MEKKKERDFTPKHFILILFAVLIALLTFIGIMNWRGYAMINMSTQYLLFGILVVSAMVAGLAALVKRIMSRAVKGIVVALGGIIIVVAAVVLLALSTFILNVNTPVPYTTLTSPAGKNVAVMREWGSDSDLMDLRAAERWANDPEAVEGEFEKEDLGYSYFAAPKVMGMFYNKNAKTEGILEIGVMSQAQLMYKWEGEVLTLYIENPEPGDAGELTLNVE